MQIKIRAVQITNDFSNFFLVISTITIFFFFNEFKQNNLAPISFDEEELVSQSKLLPSPVNYDVVFASRKIRKLGADNLDSMPSMPGVGSHSRFRASNPGSLIIYRKNGTLKTLINGSSPTLASLNLIDVNAPDVSYDGTKIVFAGLSKAPQGQIRDTMPNKVQGAWRIYVINVNGTGLTQLTNDNLVINSAQFNPQGYSYNNFSLYDDIDPIWLPDGRICFSSTRHPSNGEYFASRTTNLFVMNANGTNLHRITSERNGAERPVVDPQTGRIVYSRWWRTGRFPLNDTTTLANQAGDGFIRKKGLSSNQAVQTNGAYFLNFNGWVTGVINPDGTDLTGFHGGIGDNQQYMMYGASFTPTFDPVINYFPENILLHEGGFGGIIKHPRGLGKGTHLAGYTIYKDSLLNYPSNTPEEYRHYYSKVGYACDPDVLPDGKIIFSWAPNYKQDYGVYVMNADGTNRKLIYNTGGAQLRAKAIRSRPVPPKIADKVTSYPSMYPPLESAPYNIDGNFTFNCLNVYTNGNVDEEITTGVPFGDAGSIKFFINHQRTRKNSNPEQDFPIQLAEVTIPASGKIVKTNLPADQPLFEQLRTPSSKGYVVPSTGAPYPNSTAHVAGMNYGRPGETVTCVGCHRGHSMLPIPSAADAPYTNIAPGAAVTVSNTANAYFINFINDRKAQKAFAEGDYWITQLNLITSEWVRFGYDIPAKIRSVRIFNIPAGGVGNSSLQITKVQVRVYANKNATGSYTQVIFNQVISPNGTNLLMGNNAIGKCVEVKILAISGTYNGFPRTGLAEIEVIGSGDLSAPRQAEVDQPISMQVFPNPVKDFVTVTVNEAEPNTSCIIFNSKGEVVLSKIMNGEQSINENIDMREFANGIYFIQIASASGKTVTKIVKTGF